MSDPVAAQLADFLEEAEPGPWRREANLLPDESENACWLINEAGDSLMVDADDVAMLVNAALADNPEPAAASREEG